MSALRRLHDMPLQRKLTWLGVVTSGAALLLAGVAFATYEQFAFRRSMTRDLTIVADMIGFNSGSALTFSDVESATETLQALRAHPHVRAACIYNKGGEVFAIYRRTGAPERAWPVPTENSAVFHDDALALLQQIKGEDGVIGAIYLESSLDELSARLRSYTVIIGGVLFAAILVAWVIAGRLQRVVSGPVSALSKVARRVATEEDFTLRAPRAGNDEVGGLIDGFNAMLAQIQSRDAQLQSAHDHLERRVDARTVELQREIAERGRIESELRASQNLLHSLVENLPVFIFRKDRAGRLTFANRRFSERLGCTPEEAMGRTAFDFLPREVAEAQHALDARIMATGEAYEGVEERAARDGGAAGYLHMIRVPVRDAAGECIGVQGMFLDVTEQKRGEARLRETSSLLEALLEHSPDFIYFKDRQSRFVRASRSVMLTRKFADEAELRGKTDFDLFTTEHAQPAFDDEQEIMRSGVPIEGKLERETYADGRTTWALSTKMPWRDGTGAVIGIFGITKDVTKLKEVELKLAYERDQLRALLDSSPDTIYFKDRESRFVRVSLSKVRRTLERVPQLAERIAGGKTEECDVLNGLTDFDVFQNADARAAYDIEQEIIATGEPKVAMLEKQTFRDGTVWWHLTSKMPWRDAEGTIIGTFGISKDVTALKEAEHKLEQMHRQLLEVSRQAGMAEVATSVLHNVGNVLNSVNVSASLVVDRVRNSKTANIAKLAALLAEHREDLGTFFREDPRGRQIPGFLASLATAVAGEQAAIAAELEHLRKHVEHIKEIVAMQQSYARVAGVAEPLALAELADDALRMNESALVRHGVNVERAYEPGPQATVERHKVLQILVNLIRNAKEACDASGRPDKQLRIGVSHAPGIVRVTVSDNGVGIPPENLTRIFAHGFTTRREGHGFGLHSGALAARELGGALTVSSEGVGQGAIFTLELPINPQLAAA